MSEADLSYCSMMGADLREAYLGRANLSRAMLSQGATVTTVKAGRNDADLRREVKHFRGADLSGASLGGADLSGASLGGVNLSEADLSEADLSGADLSAVEHSGGEYLPSGANLSRADLSRVVGITNEQLEQQAYSLEGAIMPDGSTHD